MSGVKLEELGSSDMIDVLHFMFEEDMFAATGEEAEHKSKIRTTLYKEFYNKRYEYGSSSNNKSTYANGDLLPPMDEEFYQKDLIPFDPEKKSKPTPYVPVSNFNPDSVLPFGMNIDAPLG